MVPMNLPGMHVYQDSRMISIQKCPWKEYSLRIRTPKVTSIVYASPLDYKHDKASLAVIDSKCSTFFAANIILATVSSALSTHLPEL